MQRITDFLKTHIKGAPIIADQRAGETRTRDGKGGVTFPSEFDPAKHKKYHAKYYFQKESGLPITDADRTKDSLDAYNEFLEGLEQINNQEYLNDDFLGDTGKTQSEKIPSELEEKVRDVHDFAKWTRTIRTRASAHTAQQFAKKLKTRAQIGIMRDPSTCKSDMIPIREETYHLLTRPLEADFSWLGAIIYIVQIAIYCNHLYVQLNSIIGLCSNSYMCPFQTKSSGLPVLAPPVAFRDGVAATFRVEDPLVYRSKSHPWRPKIEESCQLGQPECDTPGYMIQWPYMEVDTSKRQVEFPAELIEAGPCVKEEMGENGWVFDPFLGGGGGIRSEVWRCGDRESIPFASKHRSENTTGTTTFHFKPSFYDSSHTATLKCMSETLPKYGDGTLTRKDWLSPSLTDQDRASMRQEVITCLSGEDLADNMECACHQKKWLEWAVGLYYPGSTSTKTCNDGPQDGQLCVESISGPAFDDGGPEDLSLLCVSGTCEAAFEDQVALQRNWKYGCWFTSALSASQQLTAVYFPCGFAWSTASDQFASSETLIKLQKSIDLLLSKRTLLVLVFLIKECCLLTAILLVPPLALCLLSLLIFLYYLLIAPIKFICKAAGLDMDFTLNTVVVAIKLIIFVQLRILWTMCINFSTSYRILRMALSLFRGLVNPSLRDLDVKLTTVANTVFSLVLLVATADGSLDSQVVTSLCLSLLQLLYAMNTEKVRLQSLAEPLKDVNENRLSKFEFALLLTKIMEDLLEEDVQYNWVQHFKGEEQLKPFTFTFPETLGSSNYTYEKAFLNQESLTRNKNVEEMYDEVLFGVIGEDPDTLVAQRFLEPMPSKLLRFGHDGQGFQGKVPKMPDGVQQTVQWFDTGAKYEGKDSIVRVGLVGNTTDRDLLGIPKSRGVVDADSDDFFGKPLFSAEAGIDPVRLGPDDNMNRVQSLQVQGSLSFNARSLSTPQHEERTAPEYSLMSTSRTPVRSPAAADGTPASATGVSFQDEQGGTAGPGIV